MNIHELLSRFRSNDQPTQFAARNELMNAARSGSLEASDLLIVLDAINGPMPPSKYASDNPGSSLVWAVRDASRTRPDRAPPIESIIETFRRSTPGTRANLIQLFTTRPTVESARAYVDAITGRLTGDYPFDLRDECFSISVFASPQPGAARAATPEVAAALFPAALEATKWEPLRYPVYIMLLDFLKAGLIESSALNSSDEQFAAILRETMEKALALQEENRPGHLNWKYDGPYADIRGLTCVLLDLAGQWNSAPVIEAMCRMPPFTDPRPKMLHAFSRLCLGIHVDPDELAQIAAESPRECYSLRCLGERTEWERFLPPACFDQEKLARGEMVDWLTFGTELNREPDEIELIHVETRQSKKLIRPGPHIDHYFYKFRVTEEHWAKEEGWMVGMAGGYQRTPRGTTMHNGGTFSKFEPFEEKSIEEHVKEYLD